MLTGIIEDGYVFLLATVPSATRIIDPVKLVTKQAVRRLQFARRGPCGVRNADPNRRTLRSECLTVGAPKAAVLKEETIILDRRP